ncbi:MAG: helix-turn-helix domain-containing protein [Betaproteobacteria bacterium]
MPPAPPVDLARLWLPGLRLSGCLRAGILCDTGDWVPIGRAWHNYFPATPLVSLIWWLRGRSQRVVEPGFAFEHPGPFPGEVSFVGPLTLPSQSNGSGPAHLIHLLFAADAWQALTGSDPGTYVNRAVDAREVLPADWRPWAQAVCDAADDRARLALIEAFLAARWQPLWQAHDAHWRRREWLRALAWRAATTRAGRSLRQIERRVKSWAGLPLRELRAMARTEEAFFAARAAAAEGDLRWADLAAATGYADQSHLTRETKRMSGFAPAELARRIREDEGFWVYRLWA